MKTVWSKKMIALAVVWMLALVALGTGAETVNAAFVLDEEITTDTLILREGDVWEIRNSNIDPLISQEAVAANTSISRVYPTGGSWDGSITEGEYLAGTYRIKIGNKATREVIDIKYYTEEEYLIKIHEFINGKFDEIYGTKVTWTESGSPFYLCAQKAGETFISIPKYHIGTDTDFVEVNLLIPVIIEAATSEGTEPEAQPGVQPESQPGNDAENVIFYEPIPIETEHVLSNGEEVRMIIEQGNPNEYVIGRKDVVQSGWRFYCDEIIVGQGYDIAKQSIETQIGKDCKFKMYDMGLISWDDTTVSKLTSNINVTILLNDSFEIREDRVPMVYGVDLGTGTLSKCDTVMDGRFVTFATNHFSYYVVVEQEASAGPALERDTSVTSTTSPKTADMSMIPAMMMAVSSMGVAVMAWKKRKSFS